jgi:Mrp family chromosome partitioning ATPase
MRLGVVRHGKTELGALSALKEICARENSPLDGIIMNGFDERHARSYGYGYGYGYGYNYGYRNNQGYAGAYSYSATESDPVDPMAGMQNDSIAPIARLTERTNRSRLSWMFKSKRNEN